MSLFTNKWLKKLQDTSSWTRDASKYSVGAIINTEGYSVYLECDAVVIRTGYDEVYRFEPDWFGRRKRACDKIRKNLGIK